MEFFDKDLKEMMGDRYDNGDIPTEMPVMEEKKKEAPKNNEPMDAKYTPCYNEEQATMQKLWKMTKWMGICGAIAMLMWWFEVNGLMLEEAAYPCILGCAAIGAFGAGRSSK